MIEPEYQRSRTLTDMANGLTLTTPIDKERDSLFAQPLGDVGEFQFDQSVANVFPDMLKRSIPGYQAIISQSGLLASRYAQPNTNLYDLGCSLGATSLAMHHALSDSRNDKPMKSSGCIIHGIDNSPAMINKATSIIASQVAPSDELPIKLYCDDMQNTKLQNASVVAMNFTLQFVAPAERDDMMLSIAKSLKTGGVLILSEKVTFEDPELSSMHIDMYHNFKRANGYSDLEISQKRNALENVLIPDTLETHSKRLKAAGFSSSSVWFQCFNFASVIAIK